ncbi:unnamed protein product [Cuscuta campestris]|uniref:Uncharacterized protein n=1 Tax=Cuscuta campestris TaxID=132261 RepID=A0A484LY79_9ASTE|nr:unnamed protein product [Cuscuta campestris]
MPNLLNRDCRIGKFQFGEFCKGKEAGSSPPTSGDICKFETRSETPIKSTPRGISLLSFSKASSDGSSSKDQNISCSKEHKITSHVAPHERQDSPSKIKYSKNMQFNLLSSSLSSNQLFGQSTVGHSVGLPSSSFLVNMPGSAQKALQTTLAFSAKFEPGIKLDQSIVPFP